MVFCKPNAYKRSVILSVLVFKLGMHLWALWIGIGLVQPLLLLWASDFYQFRYIKELLYSVWINYLFISQHWREAHTLGDQASSVFEWSRHTLLRSYSLHTMKCQIFSFVFQQKWQRFSEGNSFLVCTTSSVAWVLTASQYVCEYAFQRVLQKLSISIFRWSCESQFSQFISWVHFLAR